MARLRVDIPALGRAGHLTTDRGTALASEFHVYADADCGFRFRLVAANGTVLLTSGAYDQEAAAIAAIEVARDLATTAVVVDLPRRTESNAAGAPAASDGQLLPKR